MRLLLKRYLYKVHISGTFAVAPSVESELYLIANYILCRDYASAFSACGRVTTDVELSDEGRNNLDLVLKHATTDGNPNALAVVARLCLQLMDSPVVFRVNIATVMSDYLSKMVHTDACCRLTPAEEQV